VKELTSFGGGGSTAGVREQGAAQWVKRRRASSRRAHRRTAMLGVGGVGAEARQRVDRRRWWIWSECAGARDLAADFAQRKALARQQALVVALAQQQALAVALAHALQQRSRG